MSVTAVAATYQARIADRGATTVSGNVALTLAVSDMAGVPVISGPSVDVLRASTTSHPFDLECIVDTVLFTDSSRLAVIGRLIEIQRSTDAGGSWSTLATGRISGASEIDGKGKITLSVSDERWTERATQIFRTTDTVQLHPPGLTEAFMDKTVVGAATYTVMAVSGDAVRLRAENLGGTIGIVQIPAGLSRALADDLVASEDRDDSASNSAGNFTSLRFDLQSGDPATGDHEVIGFRQTLNSGFLYSTRKIGILGEMAADGTRILRHGWVYIDSHSLSPSDTVTGRFYFSTGVTVNENVPLHIGGAGGIHPGTLLKDILDGDYGGQAVLYDSTAMTILEGFALPKVWVRATEPADRAEWLEKNLLPLFNLAPLVGTDLASRYVALRLPQDITLGSLTTISASGASNTDWEHTSRDLVNVLQYQTRGLRKIGETTDRGENWPADELEPFEQRINDVEHDNTATLGRAVREIKSELILSRSERDKTDANDNIRFLAQEVFDVFGDGPARGTVTVPDDAGVEVGDLVVLDQDTLKGFNPAAGDRSGDRIVRLISFRERTPAHVLFEYLDLGPASAALSAPTVSVAQNGTDLDLIEVTISGLNAGETAVVEVDVGSSPPTDYTYRRSGVGNQTISFRIPAAAGTAYARAYAFAPNRIRSAFATDTVALASRPRIDQASVARLLSTAVVEWSVPAQTLGMRTRYDIHDRDEDPTLANQTDYDASDGGFTISGFVGTREMVTVELTPYTGWTGSAVSGTAGTTITIEGILQLIDGGIFLRRSPLTTIAYERDADGDAVVSVAGDEEAADIYVTVGDGTTPSDPTAVANDGTLSGRVGTIETGVAIATGNHVIVKAVAADADGNLGPVTTARFGSRIGPFHKDTTSRNHTGDTNETTLETITVPADTLGSNGSLRIEVRYGFVGTAGNHTLRIKLNSTTIFGFTTGSAVDVYGQVLLFNDGATNDQQAVGFQAVSSGSVNLVNNTTLAEDSTSDMDIVITAELTNGADQIDLELTHVTLIGTD